MCDRFIVLSGCSGGGKSTLLAELRGRGHAIIEEPGRRIVREEIARGGSALPWIDLAAFARRAIAVALADREEARAQNGWVFFDRSLIDAASTLEAITGEPVLEPLGLRYRYHRTVFLVPPWREIFQSDPERRHGWKAATAEHARLTRVYPALGYRIVVLPRASVQERADAILAELRRAASTVCNAC